MRKYTTIQGDMWDGVAKRIYGSEKHINTLLQANSQYKEYVVFPAGVELICPPIAPDTARIAPPWKRGRV